MKRLIIFFGLVALTACHPVEQGSPTNWSQTLATESDYQQASTDYRLRFPADFGAHPGFGIEWWYLTATLEDSSGGQYGIQWTLFRRALSTRPGEGWQTPQLFMAHAALSTASQHYFSQKYARGGIGQGGVIASPFAAWLDDWSLQSAGDSRYPMQVQARGNDFSYQLNLNSAHPPFLQGENGFSKKHGSGVGSHYYSQPFIQVQGTLQIADKSVEITGNAWLDHEWSSQFLNEEQRGWDWFALALDEHTRLMVFQLRESDGNRFRYARLMHSNGSQTPISAENVKLKPVKQTLLSERQTQLPEQWHLTIPGSADHPNIDLQISMHHPNQWMATDFPYWEGMVIFRGSHTGRGYLEMTGY